MVPARVLVVRSALVSVGATIALAGAPAHAQFDPQEPPPGWTSPLDSAPPIAPPDLGGTGPQLPNNGTPTLPTVPNVPSNGTNGLSNGSNNLSAPNASSVTNAAQNGVQSARDAASNGVGAEDRYIAFRVGGDLGYARLENEDFFAVNAQVLFRVWNFRFGLAAPLRIDTARFRLRERDWDEGRDIARIPQCLRFDIGDYDRPSDRFDPACAAYGHSGQQHSRLYFSTRFAPVDNLTFAEGTLVNAFRTTLDPDHPALGLQSHFELWDWLKVQHFVDDVVRPRVTGGRLSLWPMQIVTGRNPDWRWDNRPDELELGVTAIADLAAPTTAQTAFGRPIVDEQNNLRFNSRAIGAVGFDLHYLYIFGQGDPNSAWRFGVYGALDYDRFLGANDMDMVNVAARFVAVNRAAGWDIRVGGDYRSVGNRYVPGYFDTNYSTNSQHFALTDDLRSLLGSASQVTKLGYLSAQPDGRSNGYRAFASVTIPIPITRTQHSGLPISIFFEDTERKADATVLVNVGPVQIDQLVAGAQIVRRNFDGPSDLFSLDGTLIRMFGQVFFGPPDQRRRGNVLSNLYFLARYDRRWNLQSTGSFAVTDDVQATFGFSGGID
ncbi:MAG: hypothetical protein JNK05_17085 [Myxococcales bacterium]|nr:hypothetical protein [Myxococcales bacterium]